MILRALFELKVVGCAGGQEAQIRLDKPFRAGHRMSPVAKSLESASKARERPRILHPKQKIRLDQIRSVEREYKKPLLLHPAAAKRASHSL